MSSSHCDNPSRPVEAWLRDAHDNNWLLLEAALAVPFVVGYRTAAGVPVPAACLLSQGNARCSQAWPQASSAACAKYT